MRLSARANERWASISPVQIKHRGMSNAPPCPFHSAFMGNREHFCGFRAENLISLSISFPERQILETSTVLELKLFVNFARDGENGVSVGVAGRGASKKLIKATQGAN